MIEKVNIANINTKIETDQKKFLANISPFVSDFRTEPAIHAKVVDIELKGFLERYKGKKSEEVKIRLLAESFFGQLTEFGGFGLNCNLLTTPSGNVFLVISKDDVSLKTFIDGLMYEKTGITDNGNMIVAIKEERDNFFVYTTPWTSRGSVNVKLPLTNILAVTSFDNSRTYQNGMQKLLDVILTSVVQPKKGDVLGLIIEMIEKMTESVSIDFVPDNDFEKAKRLLK